MTLHVVGLGPGSAELLTAGTRELLQSGLPVLLRTRHHPTVLHLDPHGAWPSCDDLYQSGATFDDVYVAVAQRALGLGRAGDAIFAVPGHPLVAERAVSLILEQAPTASIDVRVHAAVSYADVAATALGIDLGGIQLCDALALRLDAQRPALISQLMDRDTGTALKLQLLEVYPADHEVVLLHALGTADEEVRPLPLNEVDHAPTSYLDSLFVPPLAPIDDVRRFDGVYAVIERLHQPVGGCPWDLEQTHESLRPHMLEEAYEALEAIDGGDPGDLSEELGDVLLQVLMHSFVAQRSGEFTFADVTEHISRKLIRRHPHVFGEGAAKTAEQVYQNWEALKQQEKPRASILEGVPTTLPALAASQSIQGRARRIGFDWPDIEGPLEKLAEEIREFAEAPNPVEREEEFGDILFVIANVAQRLGVDAEQALRSANAKFRRRFGRVEEMAREEDIDLKDLDLA
ncbi:MAG TPA: nucleoside triphosphate pyrophosphohydrolase, partial [Tepidiformaceae bacterium]|nr:nucleoside triphosphate pyrophosphohydrolase [Tepidiformaceae bacterium]